MLIRDNPECGVADSR